MTLIRSYCEYTVASSGVRSTDVTNILQGADSFAKRLAPELVEEVELVDELGAEAEPEITTTVPLIHAW